MLKILPARWHSTSRDASFAGTTNNKRHDMKQAPFDENGLTETIFSTSAVSIWNNSKGPVFWYAAGVPGPFYVNTEKLIGADAAERLLANINTIVAENSAAADKAAQVERAVMREYESNVVFQKIIATMVRGSRDVFGDAYDCISGGERRDWFFSIPFAIESGLEHVYLFKDKSIYAKDDTAKHALHVADLINNAASYFDNWIPMLKGAGFNIAGTSCVINRGAIGTDRLKDAGIRTCSLKSIDQKFFDDLASIKLIDKNTYEELVTYFSSKEEWATKYILSRPELIGQEQLDGKSKERLKSFLKNDPWNLKANDNGVLSKLAAALE